VTCQAGDAACATSDAFVDERDAAQGWRDASPVDRRTLPRSSDPRLERIAARLDALAQRANAARGWGFTLDVDSGDGLQTLQLNRYRAGGECPPHRDAIRGRTSVVDANATRLPRGLERESRGREGAGGGDVVGYARRSISVIVQLSNRRRGESGGDDATATGGAAPTEYSGGQLQLRLGTANEPSLAQRLRGGYTVDVVRRNASILAAPSCAGDAIFFTGLSVHEVLPLTSGTRESLVWWTLGSPPVDTLGAPPEQRRVWAGRTPWDVELAR
jgi:hypothetical protein